MCYGQGIDRYRYDGANSDIERINFEGNVGGEIDVVNLPSLTTITSVSRLTCENILNGRGTIKLYSSDAVTCHVSLIIVLF